MGQTRYDDDVIAWANEQAALLRAGRLSEVDIANIAEEIEDVGKSEKRELASRMAVLLAHLLKWQFQAGRRGNSWKSTIREQRKSIASRIRKTPSLKSCLYDQDWINDSWSDALIIAMGETGLDIFPQSCTWEMDKILSDDFYPE